MNPMYKAMMEQGLGTASQAAQQSAPIQEQYGMSLGQMMQTAGEARDKRIGNVEQQAAIGGW